MCLLFAGVHFDTSSSSLVTEISTAIKVYAYGVEDFTRNSDTAAQSLNTQLSCEGVGAARWNTGDPFFRVLRNVSVEAEQGKPNLEFTQDGVLKAAELKIMNLRPGDKQLVWEQVGLQVELSTRAAPQFNLEFQSRTSNVITKSLITDGFI